MNRVFFQLSAWKTASVLMMTVAPVVAETSRQNIGEISELGGSVLAGPTFSGLKVIGENHSLAVEDVIETRSRAHAVVRFVSGIHVRMGESTDLRIRSFSSDPHTEFAGIIDLFEGVLEVDVPSDRPVMAIATNTAAVQGTHATWVVLAEEANTQVWVLKGEVRVVQINPGREAEQKDLLVTSPSLVELPALGAVLGPRLISDAEAESIARKTRSE